jgi:hypothetical protein
MDSGSGKGIKAGFTAWYTVMVAASVYYGLTVLQELVSLAALGSYIYAEKIFSGANVWKALLSILLEVSAFVLSLLTVRSIYSREKRGYPLALATAAAGVAIVVLIILLMEPAPVLSIFLYSLLSVAVLASTQGAKRCLLGNEEKEQNDFL